MTSTNFKLIKVNQDQKVTNMAGWGKNADQSTIEHLNNVTRKLSGNYGILCGPRSGIIVIDYDLDKVPEMTHINFESLKEIHVDTMMVQTPKGGFHVYHEYEARFDEWRGVCGIDGFVDIRTHGNYVIGPGSVFQGKKYTLVNNTSPKKMPKEVFETFDENVRKSATKYQEGVSVSDEELELLGFTNIRWKNTYDFDCDQRGPGSTCPLCSMCHESNQFYGAQYKDGT